MLKVCNERKNELDSTGYDGGVGPKETFERDLPGFDPDTSHMRREHSTKWATNQLLLHSNNISPILIQSTDMVRWDLVSRTFFEKDVSNQSSPWLPNIGAILQA